MPGARVALGLLLAINLFNYIDRQVLAAVEPEIAHTLFPDAEKPGASDEVKADAGFRMGLLADAFLVTYMIAAPVFGFLAHRFSRWLLIAFGVVCWSLASGASGWDWGPNLAFCYTMLFLTRCFVGIGEAAYGPIAPTVLSDMYPVERRGKILSYFLLAIPVGSALGYTFGEMVSSALGWRWAFYLVVPPGLLLGLWCFMLWDPKEKSPEESESEPRMHWKDLMVLARTPSYVLNTLGMAAMTFALGGMGFWMPRYLESRQVPDFYGLGPRTMFGAILVLGGLLATLGGGWLGDKLRPRFSGSYFLVSGVAMLLGFPMILLLLVTPFPVAWIFVFLAIFFLFFNTGPTNTILANVTHPSMRAAAFAVNIFIIHILGDVPSPPLMGYLNGMVSREFSFQVVSLMVLVGGIFWLWGAVYLKRDTERIEPTPE
jgi:MFS family permease